MLFSGKTVAFHTLGCKLNFSETSAIGRLFMEKGFEKRSFSEPADVYVINTCSVTENADRECRSIVRSALSHNPDAFVAVVGCYAQLKPEEISNIEGVDVVLGATEKFKLLNYIHFSGKNQNAQIHNCEISQADFFVDAFSVGDRTRSFLKVQDGCDYKCSFCTIPLARGASRSDTVENVLANARRIAETGAREIVLTGVNLGDFGNGTEVIEGDRPKKEALFIDLIRELDQLDAVDRFRISSIEPNLLTDEVIGFVAGSKRFMPHFHVPLQSGNDRQLRDMRRRYRRDLYAERVATIKRLMPHACIGCDVIVGFPGETEDDFFETYRFIQELDVSYLHVFTYSERANTPAAEMPGIVSAEERRRRNQALRGLSEMKRREFYRRHLGGTRPVLFEQHKGPGLLTGFTDNYIKIEISSEKGRVNTIASVLLTDLTADGESCSAVLEEVLAGELL